eukprot:430360-Rhodomonas_salina.1
MFLVVHAMSSTEIACDSTAKRSARPLCDLGHSRWLCRDQALILAAKAGHANVIKMLLAAGNLSPHLLHMNLFELPVSDTDVGALDCWCPVLTQVVPHQEQRRMLLMR